MGLFSGISHAIGSVSHSAGGIFNNAGHFAGGVAGGIWKPVSHIPVIRDGIHTGGKVIGGVTHTVSNVVHSGNNIISGFGNAAQGLGNLFNNPTFLYTLIGIGALVAYKVVTK